MNIATNLINIRLVNVTINDYSNFVMIQFLRTFGTKRHRLFQILCKCSLKFSSSDWVHFFQATPTAHVHCLNMVLVTKSWFSGRQNSNIAKFAFYVVSSSAFLLGIWGVIVKIQGINSGSLSKWFFFSEYHILRGN